MQDKSLSQGQLAGSSGLTQSAISKYLNKQRKPDADALVGLASALDCTVDWLLGLEPEAQYKRNVAVGEACISLPAQNQKPLSKGEKQALEKALKVMRAPQARGGPGDMLLKSIDTVYDNVTMRAELEASGGLEQGEGSGASSAKKRRVR